MNLTPYQTLVLGSFVGYKKHLTFADVQSATIALQQKRLERRKQFSQLAWLNELFVQYSCSEKAIRFTLAELYDHGLIDEVMLSQNTQRLFAISSRGLRCLESAVRKQLDMEQVIVFHVEGES